MPTASPAVCPSCGSALAATTRRCPGCGTAVESSVRLSTPRPTDLPNQRPAPGGGPPSAARGDDPAAPGGPPAGPIGPSAARETLSTLAAGGARAARAVWRLFGRLPGRVRLIAGVVVVALVVGVPATLWLVGRFAYAPEDPVEDLVAALNDGDVERAAALANCTSRLCRPGALADGYEAPRRVRIVAVARGGDSSPDTADVRLGYDLAGERRESIVRVRQEPGLFLRGWTIAAGVTGGVEVVASGVRTARVAGIEVDLPAGGRSASTPALIGAYTVTAGGDDPVYETAPATVAVAGDLRNRGTTSVELTPTVRGSVRDDVTRQVTAFLDECAAQAAPRPRAADADCPFAYNRPVPGGATDQRWTLGGPPTIETRRPEKAQPDVVLEVRTTVPGRARFSYTYAGTVYDADEVTVSVRGVVWLDNDVVRFTPAG